MSFYIDVMHLSNTLYVIKCALLSARILHSRTGSRGDFQSVIKRQSICNLMEIFWIQIGVCCSVDRSILFPCKFFVTAKICDYKNSFRIEYSLQATLIKEEFIIAFDDYVQHANEYHRH